MGCSSSKTTTTGGDIAVVASGDEKGNVKSEVGVVEKWDKKNEVRAIDETQSELGKEEDRGATKSQKIKLAKQESKKLRLEERKQAREEKEQQRKEKKRGASMEKERRRRKSADSTKNDNAASRGRGRDDCDSDDEDGAKSRSAGPVGHSEVIVVKHSDSLRQSSSGAGDNELPELAGYDASWDAIQKPPRDFSNGARSTSADAMTFKDVNDEDTDFKVSSRTGARLGSQQPTGGAASTAHATTTASHGREDGLGTRSSAAVRARQIANRDFDDDFDSDVGGDGMYGSHSYRTTGTFPGDPVTLSPQKAGVVKTAGGGDGRRDGEKAADADRRHSSAATTTAEWVVGETENFSGSSSSDSNGLNAMGVGAGMNKGRSDSVFVHADELDNFQSELVEYGDMKLDNVEGGTYDADDARGDNGTAGSYTDDSVEDVDRTSEDEIWKELQSTYKIHHPYEHTHEHRLGVASASDLQGENEHDQMLNLYSDADVMYRHQQQQLEQQNRMLVKSFEEEKTNIDLGEEDFGVNDRDRVGVRPAISNGWA